MNDLAEVEHERRASVAMDLVHAAGLARAKQRPRALTPRDALVALSFEILFVLVCAGNVRKGIVLTAEDMDRLALAYARIDAIADEALG